MKKKQPKSVLHKISIGLLIAGLVFSVFGFIGSILGLLVYNGAYLLALIAFLVVVVALYVVVGVAVGLVFGVVNFIGLFVAAFFSALFNAGSVDFKGVWPNMDWNLVPPEAWSAYGIGAAVGLLLIPFFVLGVILSLFAMIFAIIALVNVVKGRKKGQVVTGGVFAIFSSLLGSYKLFEFAGAILAFIAKVNKPPLEEEEIKQIAMK